MVTARLLVVTVLLSVMPVSVSAHGGNRSPLRTKKPKPQPSVSIVASSTQATFGERVSFFAQVTGLRKYSLRWSGGVTRSGESGTFEPSPTSHTVNWSVPPLEPVYRSDNVAINLTVTSLDKKTRGQTFSQVAYVTVEAPRVEAIKARPAKVKPGQTVTLSVSLVGASGAVPKWSASGGQFQGAAEGPVVYWTSETPGSFNLTAKAIVAGFITLEAKTTVAVEATPAEVHLSRPTGNNNDNVVANGIPLTVQGWFIPGDFNVTRISALVDGVEVAFLDNPTPSQFQLDVSEFGSVGVKQLTIRATDTAGVFTDTTVEIRHDPVELERLGREWDIRYSSAGGGGLNKRMGPGNNILVYVEPEVTTYAPLEVVREVCDRWTYRSGGLLQFELTQDRNYWDAQWGLRPEIGFFAHFERDPGLSAETWLGYGPINNIPFMVTSGSAGLYRAFTLKSLQGRKTTLDHEMGHALYGSVASVIPRMIH